VVDFDIGLLCVELLAVRRDTVAPYELADIAGGEPALATLDAFDCRCVLKDEREIDPLPVALGGGADLADGQILPVLRGDRVLRVIHGHGRA